MTVEIERGLVKTGAGYIHYRAAGAGPAIIISHINQQSSALMIELIQALAPGARAIAVDYPSHGHSDHIASPTIEDYARCEIEVLDALGITEATSLGEATGAAVAVELACAYPDRITRAVLVNCPFYADSGASERVHAPLKGGLRPADPSGFPLTRTLDFMLERDPAHAPMRPDQSWMDRINTAQLEAGRDRWQAIDALGRYDIRSGLSRIPCPTLLLMGEHFHYTGIMHEYRARVKSLTDEVLPDTRFCATWERAGEIGRRVLAFLSER